MPTKRKHRDVNPTQNSIITSFTNVLEKKAYEAKASRGESSGLWEEEPVDIYTFLRDPDYLNLGPGFKLSDAQYEIMKKAEDFENDINTFVIWVGKGGGKNSLTRIIFLRLAYVLLCMRSPHSYFNMPPNDIFTIMNVAANSEQASAAFFEPLKNMLKMAGNKAFRQFGFNIETDMLDKEVNFPKNIQLYSGHSKADALEGRNIIVAVADEIDGDSFQKPDKMWTMLNSSANTRFVGRQKIFALSYMRYDSSNGMIKKLYDSYLSSPKAMVRKYPTWVFNPREDVTKESLADEFNKFPEMAACMYACDPPKSTIDGWIKDHDRIKASMKENSKRWPLLFPSPVVNFKNFPLLEVSRVDQATGEQIVLDPFNLEFKEWFRGIPDVSYMFVGDPGLGNVENGGDSYGIALGHREVKLDVNGKKLIRPVVDFVFRFTGYMFAEREIQFSAIHKLIEKLKDELGFNIEMFSFDQWNSVSTAQWLRSKYGNSIYINYKKNVGYEEYALLRQHIFGEADPSSGIGGKIVNGGIDWFYHEILFDELINLQEDKTKRKVDHTDFSCFTGDTKIKQLDGTIKTFKELVDNNVKEFWTISYDTLKKQYVPSLAKNPRITKYTNHAIKIYLDNGTDFTCTLDHKLLLKDGSWKEAQTIKINDSLEATNFIQKKIRNSSLYTHIYINSSWVPVHTFVFNYFNKKEKNEVLHHINFNRFDNTPNNLIAWDKLEHWKYHSELMKEYRKDVEFELHRDQKHKLYRESTAGRLKSSETMKNNWILGKVGRKSPITEKERQTYRERIVEYNKSEKHRNFMRQKTNQKNLELGRKEKCTFNLIVENYTKGMTMQQVSEKIGFHRTTIRRTLKRYNKKWEDIKNHNHKVIKIEFINFINPEPMYDVTVDVYENFMLENGNIVHNSKDMADPVASLVYACVKNWGGSGIEIAAGTENEQNSQITQNNPLLTNEQNNSNIRSAITNLEELLDQLKKLDRQEKIEKFEQQNAKLNRG